MRIDVRKYLFIGFHGALQAFFETAQENGIVHFIDATGQKIKEVPTDLQEIAYAIKIIKGLPTLDQEEPESYSEMDRIVKSVLDLKHRIDKLEEEKRMTSLEIARISVFGQFSMNDIAFIEREGNKTIQFFFSKKGVKDEISVPDELIFVASEHGLDYFFAINNERVQYDKMIEMRIDKELNELKQKLAGTETEIKEKEKALKTFAKYDQFLHHALTLKSNAFHLNAAKNFASSQVDGQLFAVEGWVPENKREKLKSILSDLDVHLVEISLEPDETPPTYLENKGMHRVGEDLVHIYDTPSNTDKDPSLWILLSFAAFFAMIINDAGYGLLFLASALYFRFKNPGMKGVGKRVWKLSMILFSFCVVWGVLTNSFFGINFGPDSGVRKVSLLNWMVEKKAAYHLREKDKTYEDWVAKYPELSNAQNPKEFLLGAKKESDGSVSYEMLNKFSDGILMELALLIGIVHISASFLRYLGRNWAGGGWILAIWGCYLYLPQFLKATSLTHYLAGFNKDVLAQEGLLLIYAGLALAISLGILQNKLYGLLEIPNIIQIFADILSYLRLYALGLAGSIISATVNDIASSIFFVGGVLLILVGHGLNIILSIIGGIIHGLRLNFIEWYHYSFDGGGKLFDPLRKIEVE